MMTINFVGWYIGGWICYDNLLHVNLLRNLAKYTASIPQLILGNSGTSLCRTLEWTLVMMTGNIIGIRRYLLSIMNRHFFQGMADYSIFLPLWRHQLTSVEIILIKLLTIVLAESYSSHQIYIPRAKSIYINPTGFFMCYCRYTRAMHLFFCVRV